jgi:hypothetical protein
MLVAGCKFDENKKILFMYRIQELAFHKINKMSYLSVLSKTDKGSNRIIKGIGSALGMA